MFRRGRVISSHPQLHPQISFGGFYFLTPWISLIFHPDSRRFPPWFALICHPHLRRFYTLMIALFFHPEFRLIFTLIFTLIPHWFHSDFTLISLIFHSVITLFSLWFHYEINTEIRLIFCMGKKDIIRLQLMVFKFIYLSIFFMFITFISFYCFINCYL